MQRTYLTSLGVAKDDGDGLVIDAIGLQRYKPPPHATDTLVLTVDDKPTAPVRVSPTGTRIDPVAARWLWLERHRVETDSDADAGVLTSSAWCTCCGRYFEDRRAVPGSWRRVARWCLACRRSKKRFQPQLRRCAADDCDVWFQPGRNNARFHAPACKEAQRLRSTPVRARST